jgi:Putative zinc-finger
MSSGECAQSRIALGVYLLGAIEPGERAELTDHLAACLACRERLAALAVLPTMLQKVPADEAIRAWIDDGTDHPPGPPLEPLLAEVARVGRRRRRWAIAAALAASFLATGLEAFHSSTPAPSASVATRWTATVSGTNPADGAWAAIRYAAMPWGSELEVRVTGVPAGTPCQLWVTGPQGQGIAAAGWSMESGGRLEHGIRRPGRVDPGIGATPGRRAARIRGHYRRQGARQRPEPLTCGAARFKC